MENKSLTQHLSIFNEKQIETLKEVIRNPWGDCDMNFGDNKEENEAYGYFTNLKKGKEHSGIMSGISKTIKSSQTKAFKHCSNWWGDGNGDILFVNIDLINKDELNNWARQN
jgi:hypothetical protein